jgi:hypothetical protein
MNISHRMVRCRQQRSIKMPHFPPLHQPPNRLFQNRLPQYPPRPYLPRRQRLTTPPHSPCSPRRIPKRTSLRPLPHPSRHTPPLRIPPPPRPPPRCPRPTLRPYPTLHLGRRHRKRTPRRHTQALRTHQRDKLEPQALNRIHGATHPAQTYPRRPRMPARRSPALSKLGAVHDLAEYEENDAPAARSSG